MDTTKFEYSEPRTEKSDSVSGITLDSGVEAWTLNGHYGIHRSLNQPASYLPIAFRLPSIFRFTKSMPALTAASSVACPPPVTDVSNDSSIGRPVPARWGILIKPSDMKVP